MLCKCGGVLTLEGDGYDESTCSWCNNPQRSDSSSTARLALAGVPAEDMIERTRREVKSNWPLVPVGAYRLRVTI